MKFYHFWPPPGKIVLSTPGKKHYYSHWKKSFRCPCSWSAFGFGITYWSQIMVRNFWKLKVFFIFQFGEQ